MGDYVIKTEQFEGPLGLLLSFIEKRKLSINDVSLAEVSDEFIQYVQKEKENGFPLGQAAEFLYVAATLLLIKSKSLLPVLDLSDEEEGSIEELERRLALYKRFRTLSKSIQAQFGECVLYTRGGLESSTPVFSPHEKITTDAMHAAVLSALKSAPEEQAALTEARVQQVITIEEMVDKLTNRIQKSMNMSFQSFIGSDRKEKVNVIVGFLAMLELVKQGTIDARQDKQFDDIMMESQNVGMPKYG